MTACWGPGCNSWGQLLAGTPCPSLSTLTLLSASCRTFHLTTGLSGFGPPGETAAPFPLGWGEVVPLSFLPGGQHSATAATLGLARSGQGSRRAPCDSALRLDVLPMAPGPPNPHPPPTFHPTLPRSSPAADKLRASASFLLLSLPSRRYNESVQMVGRPSVLPAPSLLGGCAWGSTQRALPQPTALSSTTHTRCCRRPSCWTWGGPCGTRWRRRRAGWPF